MKRLIVCSATLVATLAGFTYLTFRSDASQYSPETNARTRHEKFHEDTRAMLEKNEKLRTELTSSSPDPSVSDEVALGIVLRFISGNSSQQRKAQVRQYMIDILEISNTADQDKLFAVGETYRLQSNQIQMQSEATTLKYHPSHNTLSATDRSTLQQLAHDKKMLIRNSGSTLEQELSRRAWTSLNRSLATRVKPRIKAVYPVNPGGGG